MLRRVLRALEKAQGPVSLNQLARQLDLERGVLEGMLDYWVRKGRLRVDESQVCADMNCEAACPGAEDCPLIMKLPRTYSLASQDDD